MSTTKVRTNIDRGLYADYGAPEDDYIAYVGWAPPDHDQDEYFYISYHHGEMPAHHVETFTTIEDLIAAMRKVEPDLRKWKLAKTD